MNQNLSILNNLNPQQKEAVRHQNGPLLVLAGAGSGKTKVIAHRTANLIAQGQNPANILAVTFTNKAAEEMTSRIKRLTGGPAPYFIGTFHHICSRILRSEFKSLGKDPNFVIYDSNDQLTVLKNVLKDLRLDPKQFQPKAFRHFISKAKNQLLLPDNTSPTRLGLADSPLTDHFLDVYRRYQQTLDDNNAADFDDLLLKAVLLLKNQTPIRQKYQTRFTHILVDEYQDTNHVQYQLIKLLAPPQNNLTVVGDDWQSIYGFRGADIKNILNFERDFPDAKVLKLEQNYRSTQAILDFSHQIISRSDHFKSKTLWTDQKGGSAVKIFQAYDERDEARKIIDKIRAAQRPLPSFAVLYRTNAQSRAIEEALIKEGIPYRIAGGLKFYDRKEIKEALAYLFLIANPKDTISFQRACQAPPRGIGQKTIQSLAQFADAPKTDLITASLDAKSSDQFTARQQNALQQFAELLSEIRSASKEIAVSQLINLVIRRSGLLDHYDDKTIEGQTRRENLQELQSAATDDLKGSTGLNTFLENVALISDIDKTASGGSQSPQPTPETEKDSVFLATLHSAKGLEFPVVFLAGVEDGLLPHSRSLEEGRSLDEERRLCYVGCTRAKAELYLSFARQRHLAGKIIESAPSSFLLDIPATLYQTEGHFKLFGAQEDPEPTHDADPDFIDDFDQTADYNEDAQIDQTQPATPVTNPSSTSSFSTCQAKTPAPSTKTRSARPYKTGEKIEHAHFGPGRVIAAAEDVLTIEFQTGETKKFLASSAPIWRVEK